MPNRFLSKFKSSKSKSRQNLSSISDKDGDELSGSTSPAEAGASTTQTRILDARIGSGESHQHPHLHTVEKDIKPQQQTSKTKKKGKQKSNTNSKTPAASATLTSRFVTNSKSLYQDNVAGASGSDESHKSSGDGKNLAVLNADLPLTDHNHSDSIKLNAELEGSSLNESCPACLKINEVGTPPVEPYFSASKVLYLYCR